MPSLVSATIIGFIGALIGGAFGLHFEEAGLVLVMIGGVIGVVAGAYVAKLV